MTLGRLATGIPIATLSIFLIGCATPPRATAPTPMPDREKIAINNFFDNRLSIETDPILITYIERTRTLALNTLAEAPNANVRYQLALHIMKTTPERIDKMKALLNERRRCHQLQARLQEETKDIHEIVRTLSIAGCSQHIKIDGQ
jgi:hypothetical protein